jgi:hypothetical protein
MILTKLLALLLVLAMLGGAIRFALVRSHDTSSSSDQSWRILLPASIFTVGSTAYCFLGLLGWADPILLIWATVIVLLAGGGGSLLLVSATDVGAKALGAGRTRAWLLAGMAVFICGTALALITSNYAFTDDGIATLLDGDVAALIALAAAAALIWWSFLPVEPPVSTVFQ